MPVQKEDSAATFRALSEQFKLNEQTMALIQESKIETLNDLRFYFAAESEVGTFLAKKEGIPDVALMTARLRGAWHAIRQQAIASESDRAKVDIADLDDMLDDTQLNDAKHTFWRRYKMRYPPEITPADALVSRCSREMTWVVTPGADTRMRWF